MAHAVHPNYSEKHEEQHQPLFHKASSSSTMLTNGTQRLRSQRTCFESVHKLSGVSTQEFVVKNDMGCGSTIGPIVSDKLASEQVSVFGVPQLSMHSVREMMGTEDVDICHKHFLAFYENIAKVDASVQLSS